MVGCRVEVSMLEMGVLRTESEREKMKEVMRV